MIYRTVTQHHLSRFYDLAHLVEALMVDTEKDPKAEEAVLVVASEWQEWCDTLQNLFPNASAQIQVDRLHQQGSTNTDSYNASEIRAKFERTNELIRRLRVIYEVD